MLDHLVGSEVNETQEGSFAYDFFMTHVAFMSMTDLYTGLITRYRQKKPDDEEEGEVMKTTTITDSFGLYMVIGGNHDEEEEDSKSSCSVD